MRGYSVTEGGKLPFPVCKHLLPKGISKRNRFLEQKENKKPMKSILKNSSRKEDKETNEFRIMDRSDVFLF